MRTKAGGQRPGLIRHATESRSQSLTRTWDELLRTIPPEYREVILLRTAANMDYAAIADTLQIPIGTVRSRLNRTRQVFREALSRELFPEGGPDIHSAHDCS